MRTVGRLLIVLLLLCTGCGNSGQMAESEKEKVQREDEVSLKFSIWSDEESYVRDVIEAYNALKGYEAISLEVVPNSQHEDWVNHYNDAYATPYRGKRNSSLFLPYVIEEIAKIKGIDPKTVEETTWENAMRMYQING